MEPKVCNPKCKGRRSYWGYSREVVGTPFCEKSAKWEPVLNLGGGIVIIKSL